MGQRRLPAIVVAIVALAALAFVAAGLIFDNSLPGRLLTGGGLRPAPKQPTCSPAVVDGNIGEWILADDLFAGLHLPEREHEDVPVELYLRYDCRTNLVYALLLSTGERPVLLRRSQIRLALDSLGEEAPVAAFAWIEPGYDGNSQHARGWEASFSATQGEHLLWASTLVVDRDEILEASTPQEGTVMALACDHLPTLYLERLEAVSVGGRIQLEWETAWEVNNLGFNVYHSNSREGPWTRLNRALIVSQPAPESGAGARYEFVHAGVDLQAPNYYLLEDLASDGVPTRHGPVGP